MILASPTGCASRDPNVTAAGTVTDAATGKPIQGATVSDDHYGPPPCKSAITDAAGNYIYMTWAEEHNIVVEAPGYKPQVQVMQKGRALDFKLTRE
jgi:hypothetical protein